MTTEQQQRWPVPDPMVKSSRYGPIHIISTESGGHKCFYVTWAPYTFAGGATPARRFEAKDALEDFLRRRIEVGDDEMEKAMNDLASSGRVSIPMVYLSHRKAKELELE